MAKERRGSIKKDNVTLRAVRVTSVALENTKF
jgi:hypothetical protein